MFIKTEISLPRPPNYVRFKDQGENGVDIGSLSDDEIAEYIERWTAQLKAHHIERRRALEKGAP